MSQVLDVLFDSAGSDLRSRHLQLLEQVQVRACMARSGFKFPILEAIPQVGVPTPTGYSHTADVYRISLRGNAVSAARAQLPPAEQSRWNLALAGPLRPTVQVTAFGATAETPKLGCQSAARASVYGDLRSWLLASVISNAMHQEAAARLAADPGVSTALANWNACLVKAGVAPASNPTELAERNGDRARTHPPHSPVEVKESKADLRCSARLTQWRHAQTEIANGMWGQYARDISIVIAVRSSGGS
jgi:hypothetical protein